MLDVDVFYTNSLLWYSDAVMVLLRSLIPSFTRLCATKNNQKEDEFDCQLLPFGSYGLGAHVAGGDIDVVMLAPMSIRRSDFIQFFSKILKSQPRIFEVEVSTV
jgi:poly(A) polymerase Pap1